MDAKPGDAHPSDAAAPDRVRPATISNASHTGDPAPLGRVGTYELLVELASGGMATVFLGRTSAGQLVAIKRPHPHLAKDPIYTSMLLDEARLAAAIHHRNVVRVSELGFEGELPFIVMEYVEGSSLVELRRALAEANRALDVPVALRILIDALSGLEAAHVLSDESGRPLGIIHRDVSPHNVLVGSDGVTRLTDFGIAKAEDRVQVTRTHEVKGKLAYMAPERVDQRRLCTVQSDVFSMAIVLWECLAGRRLFRAEEPAHVLDAVLHAPIPSLRQVGATHVPPELDEVIGRALSRDLSIRYPTAAAFASALEQSIKGHLAGAADVARVIETVFSPRLRVLQESVRRVAGEEATAALFAASGLRSRPRPSPSMSLSTPEIFGAIGTEVPSDRYLVEEAPAEVASPVGPSTAAAASAKRKAPLIAAVGVGVLIGVGALSLLARDGAKSPSGREASSATTFGASQPSPSASTGEGRTVQIALPLVADRVTIDGDDRAVDPASDHMTREFPRDGSTQHRFAAWSDDGSHAEGMLLERDGVAEAIPESLVLVRGASSASSSAKPPSKAKPPHVRDHTGTRRNGFTKLK